jgi:hypothetical protein
MCHIRSDKNWNEKMILKGFCVSFLYEKHGSILHFQGLLQINTQKPKNSSHFELKSLHEQYGIKKITKITYYAKTWHFCG